MPLARTLLLLCGTLSLVRPALSQAPVSPGGKPVIFGPTEGERRWRGGGQVPFVIKVDRLNTGSPQLVFGTSDFSPGQRIPVHRHGQEDEIIFIHRGTATVTLGGRRTQIGSGSTVYIPRGTWVGIENAAQDTLTMLFIFATPGVEEYLRRSSAPEGQPFSSIPPAQMQELCRTYHMELQNGLPGGVCGPRP